MVEEVERHVGPGAGTGERTGDGRATFGIEGAAGDGRERKAKRQTDRHTHREREVYTERETDVRTRRQAYTQAHTHARSHTGVPCLSFEDLQSAFKHVTPDRRDAQTFNGTRARVCACVFVS